MLKIKKRYFILLGISFIYAWLQGGNLPYSIFYCVALVLCVSIIQVFVINRNLIVRVKFDRKVYSAGENIEFTTVIKNATIFPSSCLQVKNATLCELDKAYKGEAIYLKVNDVSMIKNKVNLRIRGVYDFGVAKVKVHDMFYMCEKEREFKHTAQIKVYPRVYTIGSGFLAGSNVFGNIIRNNRIINEDLSTVRDVRKYVRGDNLKKIHWKVSAKRGELYVRNFDTTAGEENIIFLNMNGDNENIENWDSVEEKMIDFTASLVHYMEGRGVCSEIFANAEENENFIVRKKEDFLELMDFFLTNKSRGETDFIKFINFNLKHIERFSWIGIITPSISKKLMDNILHMKDLGYSISVFYYSDALFENEEINILKTLGVECVNFNEILIHAAIPC